MRKWIKYCVDGTPNHFFKINLYNYSTFQMNINTGFDGRCTDVTYFILYSKLNQSGTFALLKFFS